MRPRGLPAGGPVAASRRRNPQDIAQTADGVNKVRLTPIDLAPKVADTRLHQIPLAGRVVAPDMIVYLTFTQDAAGVQHQELQQPELSGRERDGDAVPPDFMGIFVEFQAGHAQPGGGAAGPARRSTARMRSTTSSRLNGLVT
jgi:hypothetical protein